VRGQVSLRGRTSRRILATQLVVATQQLLPPFIAVVHFERRARSLGFDPCQSMSRLPRIRYYSCVTKQESRDMRLLRTICWMCAFLVMLHVSVPAQSQSPDTNPQTPGSAPTQPSNTAPPPPVPDQPARARARCPGGADSIVSGSAACECSDGIDLSARSEQIRNARSGSLSTSSRTDDECA
jgi:hypothetical protein